MKVMDIETLDKYLDLATELKKLLNIDWWLVGFTAYQPFSGHENAELSFKQFSLVSV